MFKRWLASWLALLAACPAGAAVNDVFPADFIALPTGTTTATTYVLNRHLSGPYQNGVKTQDGTADSNIVALRLAHFVDVGGVKVAPLAVLSWNELEIAPAALKNNLAPKGRGFGDFRAGATAWLIDDPANAHFLGVNAIVTFPTGTYHATQPVNIGENRYRLTLGAGWIHPFLHRNLLLELSPEVTFYGDNTEYLVNRRLAQERSVALTSTLRYRISPTWHAHVGWQGNQGGQTKIDGVDQHNAPNNQRWLAGGTWNVDNNNQLILRWLRDYRIDNGFKMENEVALRWLRAW